MEPTRAAQPALGINSLPDDLLARVFTHLSSVREFRRVNGVCRAWRAGGSPLERALRLHIAARGDAVTEVSAASTTRQICWLELFRAACASSGLVSASRTVSAAVDAQGRLLVWGTASKQRGGAVFRFRAPTLVTTPLGARVERVAVGYDHVLALTDTGDVLAFGDHTSGQLGYYSPHIAARQPAVIERLRGVRVVSIAAGFRHSMVLTDEGVVYSFGAGHHGQLGLGDEQSRYGPKVIKALRDVRVVAIAAGRTHSLALTDEGTVLSFGYGGAGELGQGFQHEQSRKPMVIEALRGTRVVAIAAGTHYSMVLTDEGVVLSFGWGSHGQLGHGDLANQTRPKVIEKLRGERVVAIAAGEAHSMVLTDGGAVLSFGRCGMGGELGHGDQEDQLEPKAIEALRGVCVAAIAAGGIHSLVLTEEGTVLSFGGDDQDQLGRPPGPALTPSPISGLHRFCPTRV